MVFLVFSLSVKPNHSLFLISPSQSAFVCCHIHNVPCQLRGIRCPVCQSSGQPHRANPEPFGPEQSHTARCHPTNSGVHCKVMMANYNPTDSLGVWRRFFFFFFLVGKGWVDLIWQNVQAWKVMHIPGSLIRHFVLKQSPGLETGL